MVVKAVQKEKGLKEAAKAHWQCMTCGSDFWGAKKNPHCPECKAEGFDLRELNADGIPIEDVKSVVSKGAASYDGGNPIIQKPKAKIDIDLSRAAINNADELSADMFQRDMEATIQDSYLARMKAKAAAAKAEQIEGEQRVKALDTNQREESGGLPGMPNTNYLSASTLIQSISNLPEEERQWWLEQLKDPQAVYGLATLLNPPKQTMQGNTPFMQQQNPLMSLMGMKQQMAEPAPQGQGGEESSSMLEMAEALKIMFDMAKTSIPTPVDATESNRELKDALLELKDSQDKLNDRYMALRIEQAEGGGSGSGVTKEELEMLIDTKLQTAAKSPKEMISELTSIIGEVDSLRNAIEVKPTITEHGEPIEDWVKKHTMESTLQKEQMEHEAAVENARAKKAKWEVGRLLLSEGIKENIKARTRGEDDKEEEEEEEEKTSTPNTIRRSKVTLVK
jgi:hypothetical protein